MRLNLPKLKSMGIDNIQHWSVCHSPSLWGLLELIVLSLSLCSRQLALEIAKLKIYQESLELQELEDENQISFL